MRLLLVVLALGMVPPAHADELSVLKARAEDVPPGKRLYVFLENQARAQFDARRAAVAALKTPGEIARRQAELKARFRKALGELPAEKTPLNAQVVARAKREGYRVENVIYESRPGHHVTANLYLPDGPPPFPGVIVPCGHSANGKAAETYQRISILLAKNGIAALCYDPIGQGERIQLLNDAGKPAFNGSTTEHTMVGLGALLVGRTVAGYHLWDGVRSLDYLESRPEIDPKRLGCTGNSGGGTMTAYLMAFDPRIAAAAPSCYITSLQRLFATIGPQDAEQNLPGQVALGIEHADYITIRAPRPTLLSVGTRDFFDIDGSWTTFREVKKLYCALGYGERVDLFESDEPHGFTKPRRQACMRWMRRWLLDKDDAPVEAEFSIAPDRALQCTKSGQVVSDFSEVSAFAMNAGRASKLERERGAKRLAKDGLRDAVRKKLALPPRANVIVNAHPPAIQREGYTIDTWPITTEPGMTIPVLLFRAANPAKDTPVVVYIGADRALAAPGGQIEIRVMAGEIVALIEPRGMGETAPAAPGKGGYGHGVFGGDEREAFLAMHIDRPLLGQRVYDVIQALSALDSGTGFRLIGVGKGGPIALHVAALDDRVKAVELERSIPSWRDVARTPRSVDQLANVVPGVLEVYDLPDLAEAIAPRPLTIRNAVDPAGVPANEVR